MDHDYKPHKSFPLRLSPSLRQHATEMAHNEGISINHFISLAVAEKVSKMQDELMQAEKLREQRAQNSTTVRLNKQA